MSAYRRPGRRARYVKVPTQDGQWVERTTGTRDRVTARQMHEMLTALGPEGKHAWDVLSRITAKPQTLSVGDLWARWISTPRRVDKDTGEPIEPGTDERLKHVRASLREIDLRPLVETWHGVLLKPGSGVAADTADHYRAAVQLLIPKPDPADPTLFPVTKLSERELRVWLEEMDDVESATVRKRGIGMHRFLTWLVGRGHLLHDPMRDIALPPAGPPLCHYLDTSEAVLLADACGGQQRHLEYLLPGAALEVSTALGVRVRAVSVDTKSIHAPGTKTYNRDRVVRVAEWAWPAVRDLLKGKHRDSLLFDRIRDRWEARDAHSDAVTALVEKGHWVYATPKPYTMRDHRHTWAVRAVRSGWPIGAVARQLGHRDGVLAFKVYGKFEPQQVEVDRWERLATARDRELAKQNQGKRRRGS